MSKILSVPAGMSLQSALSYHLSCQFFPPVHPDWLPTAVRAVEKIKKGDIESNVRAPKGWKSGRGSTTVRVAEIADDLRLWGFAETSPWGE